MIKLYHFVKIKSDMSKFEIWGGQKLKGIVKISGSKNAVLKMMVAAILAESPTTLENVPQINDVLMMSKILESVGAKIEIPFPHILKIIPPQKFENPNPKLISKIRASIVLVGPLLAKMRQVSIPFPGGDLIGARPISTHLNALSQLGVRISKKNSTYFFECPKIFGRKVVLDETSVTATENLILTLVNLKGESEISNAAAEPEITELCQLLNKMGAKIIGLNSHRLKISGVNKLFGVRYRVPPDRIETGTFALAAAITEGEVELQNVHPPDLDLFWLKLQEASVNLEFQKDKVYIKPSKGLKSVSVETRPYPGFPTDLQAPISVLLAKALGKSRIFESMYENRQGHLGVLQKMGVKIKILDNRTSEIEGPVKLYGQIINSSDIRMGATLILAGLSASGKTEVLNINHIDRGYENIEGKLSNLGAKIIRKN